MTSAVLESSLARNWPEPAAAKVVEGLLDLDAAVHDERAAQGDRRTDGAPAVDHQPAGGVPLARLEGEDGVRLLAVDPNQVDQAICPAATRVPDTCADPSIM